MNTWAASGKYDAHFLCVCVLGDPQAIQLAREMGKQMRLSHCVNGYVDGEKDLPTYGQLGCSGFVILDEEHRVVSKATSPFMQVRDLAFRHVEALLNAVTARKPLPQVCPGEFVQFASPPQGQEKLKGEPAVCINLSEDGAQLDLVLVGRGSQGRNLKQVPVSAVQKIRQDDDGDSCDEGCEDAEDCTGDNCTSPCGDGKESCGQGGYGGCGPTDCGGCADDSNQCDSVDNELLDRTLGQLVSVKVQAMDEEHDECAVALRQMATQRTEASLLAVAKCLGAHFAHEEALFDEHGFGEHKNEKLSAKKSHIQDHQRILRKIANACADGKRRRTEGAEWRVSVTLVRELLEDFHEHTTRYDVQYADALVGKVPTPAKAAPCIRS